MAGITETITFVRIQSKEWKLLEKKAIFPWFLVQTNSPWSMMGNLDWTLNLQIKVQLIQIKILMSKI